MQASQTVETVETVELPPDFTHRLSDGQANTIYTAAYQLRQQGRD